MKEQIKALKALADPTRLRIARLLLCEEMLCSCQITAALKMKQPSVSKALKVLKEAGIIRDERRAQWIYFGLDMSADNTGVMILKQLEKTIKSGPDAAKDRKNLACCLKTICPGGDSWKK